MKYDFQYHSGARSFEADFGRVINATDGGFERGYAAGYTEGETAATEAAEAHNAVILTDCNAVLPTKGVETADTLEQVPQRIGEIKAEPRWVSLVSQPGGMLARKTFPANTELVMEFPGLAVYNDSVKEYAPSFRELIYQAKNITKLTLISDVDTSPIIDSMMYNCQSIVVLDISKFPTRFYSMTYAFYLCLALEEIIGEIDASLCTAFGATFNNIYSLREARFKPQTIKVSIAFPHSDKLSDETLQSIIDGLADLTGQTAITLTVHKTVGEKMTPTQKATLTAKNVTLVY